MAGYRVEIKEWRPGVQDKHKPLPCPKTGITPAEKRRWEKYQNWKVTLKAGADFWAHIEKLNGRDARGISRSYREPILRKVHGYGPTKFHCAR